MALTLHHLTHDEGDVREKEWERERDKGERNEEKDG